MINYATKKKLFRRHHVLFSQWVEMAVGGFAELQEVTARICRTVRFYAHYFSKEKKSQWQKKRIKG